MAIKPLFASQATSQRPKNTTSAAELVCLIRDQLSITTWILLGGLLQASLFFLPIRRLYAVAPVVIVLLLQIIDHVLMAFGITRNKYMDNVIRGKFASVFPGPDGTFKSAIDSAPANDTVAVLLLGARVNHPLGAFGPGVSELGTYADPMYAELQRNPEEWGFLGSTSWIGTQRSAGNEVMTVYYFRSKEHVHRFAHSPVHREGWEWWRRTAKKYEHIGIMHELYEVPAGRWESIYANYHPTGLAATSHPVTDSKGEKLWMSGIVDASRGKMRSSAGRIGLDDGAGNEKYGEEIYADLHA